MPISSPVSAFTDFARVPSRSTPIHPSVVLSVFSGNESGPLFPGARVTRLTTSACQEREHHGIAARDFENISAYALNDSCAFVSEHDWLWHRVVLVTCNHICVAQAAGHDLDQYFISARAFQS